MSEAITKKLNVGGEKANGNGSANAAHLVAHPDRQQIDVGVYKLKQKSSTGVEILIGELFVVEVDPTTKIEYWAFKPEYQQPTMTSGVRSIEFHPDREANFASAADFVAYLGIQGYSKYIEATCIDKSVSI